MIRVRDLERSLAFYVGFLGLRKVRERPIGDEAVLVFLTDEVGAYHIELTWNRDGRDYVLGDQFGHLAFFTDDLDAVIRAVEERGWPYRRSRPEIPTRYIFVKDPDGYEIEILENRPR
ncbi:MAG: lactoylglutathione lyase [Acidobacteria bacterium]|nr:MAG: lactoylglutathione lyase [Acidobacteriota bacterium]